MSIETARIECLRLAEHREEALERLGVAARRAPHDCPRAVVEDRGQVALVAAIGNLIDADLNEAMQAALIELLLNDALHNPPDAVPRDPQEARDRLLGHLLRQPRDHVLEVTRVARAAPGPRHGLKARAAVWAPEAAQLALDQTARAAEIEMAPALCAPAVDGAAELAATRAHPSAPPQTHGDDHPLGGEAHVDHPRPGQAQQPVECRGGTHLVLLRKSLIFVNQQPAGQGRCVPHNLRNFQRRR
jgi:hypothetical protein